MPKGVSNRHGNKCLLQALVLINSRVILNTMARLYMLNTLKLVYLWILGAGTQILWKIIPLGFMTLTVSFNIRGMKILGKLTIGGEMLESSKLESSVHSWLNPSFLVGFVRQRTCSVENLN